MIQSTTTTIFFLLLLVLFTTTVSSNNNNDNDNNKNMFSFKDSLTIRNQHEYSDRSYHPTVLEQYKSSSSIPQYTITLPSEKKSLTFFAIEKSEIHYVQWMSKSTTTANNEEEKIHKVSLPEPFQLQKFCAFVGTMEQQPSHLVFVSAIVRNVTESAKDDDSLYCTLWTLNVTEAFSSFDDTSGSTGVEMKELKGARQFKIEQFSQRKHDGQLVFSVRDMSETDERKKFVKMMIVVKLNLEPTLIPFGLERIQQIVFPLVQHESEPLGLLVQIAPEEATEPSPRVAFYHLKEQKPNVKIDDVLSTAGGGNSLLDTLETAYLFVIRMRSSYSAVITIPTNIFVDPDGSKGKPQNIQVVIQLPTSQEVPADGLSVLLHSEYYVFNTIDRRDNTIRLYRTNGKSLEALLTYDAFMDLEQPKALDVLESLTSLYILLDNKRQILEYPDSDFNVKIVLPLFAQVEEEKLNSIRFLKAIGSTVLVEYCPGSSNCTLGYINPASRVLSQISSSGSSIKKITALASKYSEETALLFVSDGVNVRLVRIEFKSDDSKCFPFCGHGSCQDSGLCSCDRSQAKGFWDIGQTGSCSKCAKNFEDPKSGCTTRKKEYSCYNVKSSLDSVCSGHGECVGDNKCKCDADFENGFWTGEKCDKCLGNYDENLRCQKCQNGWQGKDCTEKVKSSGSYCFGIPSNREEVCSHHGKCKDGECQCDRDQNNGYWDGAQCQYCLNHFDYNKGCKVCLRGYEGSLCESRKNITIYDCYGVESDEETVCSGHGFCVANNNCSCDSRYFGSECQNTWCFGVSSNRAEVCSGEQGSCVRFNECKCKAGYTGYDCKVWDEGNGAWVTIIVMSALSGVSVVIMLAMVGYFKVTKDRVEYSRINGFQGFMPYDDDEYDEYDEAVDLFMNAEENESEFDLVRQPDTLKNEERLNEEELQEYNIAQSTIQMAVNESDDDNDKI